MSSIGPQIPAHLLAQFKRVSDDDDEEGESDCGGPQPEPEPQLQRVGIGPQIPEGSTKTREVEVRVYDDDDDDEGVGPVAGPSVEEAEVERRKGSTTPVGGAGNGDLKRRVLGPSFPGRHVPTYAEDDEDEEDDDDIGPKPFIGSQYTKTDAVKEFMEKEEKRRKAAEEALKPKAPKRDEWMLVPPTTSSLLGNLDPTKLKARQFSRGTTVRRGEDNDMSLWTETPAERQQRITDEVQGKKRRVTDAAGDGDDGDEEEMIRKRRRKEEEEAIRKRVDEHTKKRRGGALIDQHVEAMGKKEKKGGEEEAIWDHARDMGVGGRLMDDDKRSKMVKEAKGLGARFGTGSTGGFL